MAKRNSCKGDVTCFTNSHLIRNFLLGVIYIKIIVIYITQLAKKHFIYTPEQAGSGPVIVAIQSAMLH